jgi:hypothetical protein
LQCIAGIRLVLATAIIILFSGTMAFAHSGHAHAPAASPTVSQPAAQQAVAATPVHFARLSTLTVRDEPRVDGPIVTASDGTVPSNDCGSGNCGSGCCCDGTSSCSMAYCHALALPAADQRGLLARGPGLVPVASSDHVAGGLLFGLDRPPKI